MRLSTQAKEPTEGATPAQKGREGPGLVSSPQGGAKVGEGNRSCPRCFGTIPDYRSTTRRAITSPWGRDRLRETVVDAEPHQHVEEHEERERGEQQEPVDQDDAPKGRVAEEPDREQAPGSVETPTETTAALEAATEALLAETAKPAAVIEPPAAVIEPAAGVIEPAGGPKTIELDDEARASLAMHSVSLDPVPASPTASAARVQEDVEKLMSLPRLIARTLHSKRATELAASVDQAVSRESSVLKAMELFYERTFRALAEAWEEAGAPGADDMELHLDKETASRTSKARKLRVVNERRIDLRMWLDKHARRVKEHMGELDRRLKTLNTELDVTSHAHADSASGGSRVKERLRASLSGDRCAWLDRVDDASLPEKLAERLAELRSERERLQSERAQAEGGMQQEVRNVQQRLAQLEQEITDLRDQNLAEADELKESMVRIGKMIEPLATSFTNGEQIRSALCRARQREMEARKRKAQLEAVGKDLKAYFGLQQR